MSKPSGPLRGRIGGLQTAVQGLALLFCLLMAGCGNNDLLRKPRFIEDSSAGPELIYVDEDSSDFEITAREDGWMYVSNATLGTDWARFRIKGKRTTWDDFDVESLTEEPR